MNILCFVARSVSHPYSRISSCNSTGWYPTAWVGFDPHRLYFFWLSARQGTGDIPFCVKRKRFTNSLFTYSVGDTLSQDHPSGCPVVDSTVSSRGLLPRLLKRPLCSLYTRLRSVTVTLTLPGTPHVSSKGPSTLWFLCGVLPSRSFTRLCSHTFQMFEYFNKTWTLYHPRVLYKHRTYLPTIPWLTYVPTLLSGPGSCPPDKDPRERIHEFTFNYPYSTQEIRLDPTPLLT